MQNGSMEGMAAGSVYVQTNEPDKSKHEPVDPPLMGSTGSARREC